MIFLDTSVLVDALTGTRPLAPVLIRVLFSEDSIRVPTLVLYEWWRGPRAPSELEAQRLLFPENRAVRFGPREARVAAGLYQTLERARGREMDIAIAACAIAADAEFWTQNRSDFADIPKLTLFDPAQLPGATRQKWAR